MEQERLRVTEANAVRTIDLGEELELGRSVDGPGKLADETVSRRHAAIKRKPGGRVVIEDLDSSNGTYVNGVRVIVKELRPGDSIQLGGATLELVGTHTAESGLHQADRIELARVTAISAIPPPPPPDPAALRAEFPVFERVAYLNAGTDGPVPRRALDVAAERIRVVLEQGRSGPAHIAQLQAMAAGLREQYARVLGCAPEQVALTRSTNDGINSVISGLHLRRRDEVLTSDEEHPSLLAPLARLRRRLGVDIRIAPFEEIASAAGPRTRLIACSHVSWVTGRVADTDALRASGVPLLLDGAQALGAIPVDVRAIGCDYYAAPGQKWLCGPDGTGVLYVHPDRIQTLDPPWPSYFTLGDPGEPLELVYHSNAARFDLGNVIGALATWALASLELLEDTGWDFVLERGPALAERFAADLSGQGIEVMPRGRSTLVSWRAGRADEQVLRLADERFVLRSIPGRELIRASVGAWSSEEELDRLAGLAA